MIKRLGIATYMCYTILESPEHASKYKYRRILIFVPQLEFSMFQTFDFRCFQTLATAAPSYRGGVYVINITYSKKLRSVAPPFSIMLYIVSVRVTRSRNGAGFLPPKRLARTHGLGKRLCILIFYC